MGFLTGKKFLITGISSNRSIAYGIAKACAREGAELALSYNNERFKERVQGSKKGKKGSKVAVDFSANLTAQFYSNQSKICQRQMQQLLMVLMVLS